MYKEAEEAFMKLLEFDDINEPELEEELVEVRVLQLQVWTLVLNSGFC